MIKTACFVILILVFFLTGCADQYSIEKEYWQAKKQKESILSNPDASPQNQLDRTVATLNKFIQKNPSNKLTIDAELDIATVYTAKKEYEKARDQLKMMINKYKKSETICSEAQFLIGSTYQMEGKWDSALTQYNKVIQNYPRSMRGMDMPIYIAEYYKVKYQPEKMMNAYRDAIDHYLQLGEQYPKSQLAFYANRLAGRCYMEIKEWQNALDIYAKIMETYKGKADLSDILMNIALIYGHELKNKEKAIQTAEEIIRDYPNSSFKKAAEFLLKEWNKK